MPSKVWLFLPRIHRTGFPPGIREVEKGKGGSMIFRSFCCSTLFGLLLGGPALCQTSSTPADQSAQAASLTSPPSAPVPKTDAQPEKSKPPSAPGETARTAEENRERLLLDRIDQLEKRLSELEARGPAAAASAAPTAAESQTPTAVAAATPAAAPAATPAPQDPAPASAPTWSVGPIDFSGFVDGYYSFNPNQPPSQFNQPY